MRREPPPRPRQPAFAMREPALPHPAAQPSVGPVGDVAQPVHDLLSPPGKYINRIKQPDAREEPHLRRVAEAPAGRAPTTPITGPRSTESADRRCLTQRLFGAEGLGQRDLLRTVASRQPPSAAMPPEMRRAPSPD